MLGCLVAAAAPDQDTETASVDRGAEVYDNFCATCHGAELQNNTGVAFDLRRLHDREHARFINSVEHGKNAMPAWQGRLTDDQMEALWAYIRANAYDAQQ